MNAAVLGYEPIALQRLLDRASAGTTITVDVVAWAVLYADLAPAAGVRTAIAWAQALHETGYFTFGGRAKSDWNNPCGLGVGASSGAVDCHFASRATGVRAHLGHLIAYFDRHPAHAAGFCEVDPRHVAHRALENDVRELGGPGRWAPSPDYGDAVLGLAQGLL